VLGCPWTDLGLPRFGVGLAGQGFLGLYISWALLVMVRDGLSMPWAGWAVLDIQDWPGHGLGWGGRWLVLAAHGSRWSGQGPGWPWVGLHWL
jgi:hypothetical protein